MTADERQNLRQTAGRIAKFYQDRGKPAQAAEWRFKLKGPEAAPNR
jgi:hypothetical protein